MLSINLDGIRVYAHHGVLPDEKREGQEFVIDVEVELDVDEERLDDNLANTLDYARLAVSVQEIATRNRFDLLETLAGRIATYILTLDDVKSAKVRVRKMNAPLEVTLQSVGVTATRVRADE
ncbi:MAG: dihydroneopterin aldolase [Actinomycetota bacterium]|nr:dihydroneopterin aldolase [Actinomycetota bacterium]